MRKNGTNSAIATLVVIAAWFSLVFGLHADQSMQEGIHILTNGYWFMGGRKKTRVTIFRSDGSLENGNLESGKGFRETMARGESAMAQLSDPARVISTRFICQSIQTTCATSINQAGL